MLQTHDDTMQANKFPPNAEYCMIVRKLIYSVPESIPVNAQCFKQCNENRLTMCDLWPWTCTYYLLLSASI